MSEGTATPVESTHSQPPTPPGQPAQRPASHLAPATLVPENGWHFLHVFYKIDRAAYAGLSQDHRERGKRELEVALATSEGVEQIQSFVVPGHKADFGFMAAGPDLKALHAIETSIAASAIGPALTAAYSFYSITEISE